MIKKYFHRSAVVLSLVFAVFMLPSMTHAVSFSADAVQIREGHFSHARMYWSEGRVRFEYLDEGVAMVQIYDTIQNKVIWLDTEEKQYMVKVLPAQQQLDPMISKSETVSNPCSTIEGAVCTRLKDVVVNDREAVKWLITTTQGELDSHTFLWVDKEYEIVVREEAPDNTLVTVRIEDDHEFDGRKVRKLTVYTYAKGYRDKTTQWYDDELNIIVRQQYENSSMDELRNIKIEDISEEKFIIPADYKEFDKNSQAVKTDQG